jgi:1-acyl-sn-glycerol-3-phosphate acyltransferase
MVATIGSVLFWSFMVVSSAAMFPIALLIWAVTSPFDPRKKLLHRFTCLWASLYTWLNPVWRITLVGRQKIHNDRAAVMVVNHASFVDILVLFRTFVHFKFVSKTEVFRVPFIGWNMLLNGYIGLKRGDRESVLRMLEACRRAISRGNSILMFPEGTRSTTGRMRAFKPGAFELALSTSSPIQPIVIHGSGNALPKRGFVLRGKHSIRVTVLDPILPEEFADASAEELMGRVRSRMAEALGEMGSDPIGATGR